MRPTENVFILSCQEDKDLIQHYRNAGWDSQVLEVEFVLSGLLKQQLEVEKHQLKKRRRCK